MSNSAFTEDSTASTAEATTAAEEAASAPSEVDLARAVREAVRGLPGVHDLAKGRFVEAATYGPLALVRGVVVHEEDQAFTVEIHVIPEYSDGLVLPRLADEVRAAVHTAVRPSTATLRRIDVAIDDLWIEQQP